ncbi:unnamed protein product, partial [Prunus brigantina]
GYKTFSGSLLRGCILAPALCNYKLLHDRVMEQLKSDIDKLKQHRLRMELESKNDDKDGTTLLFISQAAECCTPGSPEEDHAAHAILLFEGLGRRLFPLESDQSEEWERLRKEFLDTLRAKWAVAQCDEMKYVYDQALKERRCKREPPVDDFGGLACPPLDDLEAVFILETVTFDPTKLFDDVKLDDHDMAIQEKPKKPPSHGKGKSLETLRLMLSAPPPSSSPQN